MQLEPPLHDDLRGIDRAKLDALVEPIVRAFGAEVVDIEWRREQPGWVLRVLLEKVGAAASKMTTAAAAVDLDLCSNVARELSTALDADDVVPHAYSLEVGSPGLERDLRRPADYERFLGERAKVKVHEAVAGQKVLVGKLGPLEGGVLTLQDGGVARAIPLNNVAHARLVFEMTSTPKKPKPQKRSRARG